MATILGKVMITLGGDYSSAKTYDPLTGVTHNGSFYISKQTVQGVEPGTNDNYWQLSAQGYPGSASGVPIVDSQGMVVTAGQTTDLQTLENAIADRVMNKLLAKTDLLTQYINDTTKPAAASLAYDLNSQISTLNSDLLLVGTIASATLSTGFTGTIDLVNVKGCPRIVVVNINVIKGSAIVSGDTVVQLPFGCFTGFFGGGVTLLDADGTQNTAYLTAGTDGSIKVTTSTAAARWIRGQIIVYMGN